MEKSLKVGACDLAGSKKCNKNKALPPPTSNQKGSLILEAIIVLGMIATFTPMLYKHVADRRADLENINRANTLLYLQQKAEDYLKDPDNVTALVNELGHNQHKEIFPSEMGAGSNFDGRYIVGIRREDENNKPVLKAMIIDTVHTGSDLRAAKVAELIGLSAGIYTAVDPDAAWGINGFWSEPLSRYFDTTDIPTGAVAITTEYNKAKYRMNISDILVDADLDMGEFEVTAEQINAVRIAAENGTLDQLIAQDVRASNKVVAGKKLCVGGEEAKDCIESWEDLNVDRKSDLQIVQECDAGMTDSCAEAYTKELNRTCSEVDAVYDRAGVPYPSPKIYTLTYGSGTEYTDVILTKCEGTSFIVDNISTATLTNPVEQVGDYAFGITTPGWYQVTLMGGQAISGTSNDAAGGILIANTHYDADIVITLKGIKGGVRTVTWLGGAGVALWDTINTTGIPTLVAGGGGGTAGGSGYVGGTVCAVAGCPYHAWSGYGWDESIGGNSSCCTTPPCNNGATGGCCYYKSDNYEMGGIGTGSSGYPCPSGYTCTTITGGATLFPSGTAAYPAASYGNWNASSPAPGYASIIYCGTSENDCPVACGSDSDCPSDIPYCSDGACTDTKACTASSQCTAASLPDCNNGYCVAPTSCTTDTDCSSVAGKPYCYDGFCSATQCASSSECSSSKPYCVSGVCSATCTANSQCPSNKPYCSSGSCVQCTANSQCPSSTPYCVSKACSAYPPSGTVMYQSSSNGSYTIPAAGRYKIVLRGGKGGGSGTGGTLTATIYYNKSAQLSTSFPAGGCYEAGSGVILSVGGSKVLAAGGGGGILHLSGGNKRCCWGGGYGGSGISSYCPSSNQTCGAGTGRSAGSSTGATTSWALGGTGYCASGYSCSGTCGGNSGAASITLTYCGSSSSSSCP